MCVCVCVHMHIQLQTTPTTRFTASKPAAILLSLNNTAVLLCIQRVTHPTWIWKQVILKTISGISQSISQYALFHGYVLHNPSCINTAFSFLIRHSITCVGDRHTMKKETVQSIVSNIAFTSASTKITLPVC